VAAALALLVVLTSSSSDTPSPDSASPIVPSTTTTTRKRRPAATPTTTTAQSGTTGPTSDGKTYTVQAGDFLSTVAEKTGVSVDRLRELNPGLDANSMTVGQQIKLAP
jgi:LysM repeat protein